MKRSIDGLRSITPATTVYIVTMENSPAHCLGASGNRNKGADADSSLPEHPNSNMHTCLLYMKKETFMTEFE